MTQSRTQALRRRARQHGCDALLVSDPVDVRYASGFRSSSVSLLLNRRGNWLCTDFRYEQAARRFCENYRSLRPVINNSMSHSWLAQLLRCGTVLGVQADTLTLAAFEGLKRALPGRRFVKLGAEVLAIGVTKSPAEARTIARCARIGDRGLAATVRSIRLGMAEREVRDMLEAHCRALGSEGPAFDTIVLFGARTALPHGVPTSRRLKKGDFILFDFGCRVDGFCADMTRTFVAGRASARQKLVYRTVQKAQAKARLGLRAGVELKSVDTLARSVIAEAGYGPYFGHATGHGLGFRVHEAPRLGQKSRGRVNPGVVVTVEPGIYIPKFGGVRIEDTVYVGRERPRVLTHFPRELVEL